MLSRPLTEQKQILLHVPYAYVTGRQEEAALDAYFRRHFPRTYALYDAQFQPEPESSAFDYGPRHLGMALSAQTRFKDVRLHKNVKTGGTIVTAPKSLSKKDVADLRILIRKHLGDKAELVFQ